MFKKKHYTTYNLLNISVALSYRSELVVEGAGQSLIMGNQQTTANPTATTNPKALPLLSACQKREALPLLSACQKRDMETVSILLASSMDHLHAIGECGRTPILLASALGSLPVLYDSASRTQFLGYLLSRGARVSDRDNDGWTPLHHCCAAGDLDGVRLLIENGGDPDATNNQGIRAIEFLDRDYVVPGRVAVPEYAEIQLRQSSQSLRDSSSPLPRGGGLLQPGEEKRSNQARLVLKKKTTLKTILTKILWRRRSGRTRKEKKQKEKKKKKLISTWRGE